MTPWVAKASQLIDCEPAAAFEAFVDPARITQFWLDSASGPLVQGATVTWHFKVPGAKETLTVDRLHPPQLIAFTWSSGLKVRLEFTPHAAGQTRVSAEARGFSGDDGVAQVVNATEGFSIVLCDLKTLLESGRSANLVRAKAQLIAAAMAASKKDG